jgi:AAA15 family ATPase/GTPase
MKYQTITIENFRGISKLEITDLKRINLLVGKNNCGKTSVLEAGLLLAGMTNPQFTVGIHTNRNLFLGNNEDFCFMFKNLDFSFPILLKSSIDSIERRLIITPSYESSQTRNNDNEIVSPSVSLSATSNIRNVGGINLDFELPNGEKYHSECHLAEGKITTKPLTPTGFIDKLKCQYFNPASQTIVIDKQLEYFIVQKKLPSLISVLKGIEPTIQHIIMGTSNMVHVDTGAKRYFPINIMGDGFRKILTLLVSLASLRDGILLVDEIENGLHYSSVLIAWKAIIAACKEYNVQLIATTHSYECVKALSKTCDTLEPSNDDIRLIRIDRDGEKHGPVTYDAKILKKPLKKD